jgi:hypothetical protein
LTGVPRLTDEQLTTATAVVELAVDATDISSTNRKLVPGCCGSRSGCYANLEDDVVARLVPPTATRY